MKTHLKIGSRESALAVRQAEIVKEALEKASPGLTIEIVTMKTTGDKILHKSLEKIGGKGLFVKELDRALLNGDIDLSVHSLKDMPMEIPKELPVIAYTKREDPRDALILKPGIQDLKEGGIIGSSSRRRSLQAGKLYPKCNFKNIATILALAGLKRLGMEGLVSRIFSVDEMIPSAGQGILAVQGRKGEKIPGIEAVDCSDSRFAAKAERGFVRYLNGGCTSPVAAYAQTSGNEIQIRGLYYHEETGQFEAGMISGEKHKGEILAERLARSLKGRF